MLKLRQSELHAHRPMAEYPQNVVVKTFHCHHCLLEALWADGMQENCLGKRSLSQFQVNCLYYVIPYSHLQSVDAGIYF
jgi:hypothetical protein